MTRPHLTIAELEALMDRHFTTWRSYSTIESHDHRELVLRMPFRKDLVRAGGTISGPAMMALADTAAYYLTLIYAGPVPEAATANLDIHFLARPQPIDMLATARLLRLGRRLAVSTVDIRSAGTDDVVAHATVTYALPSVRAT
jgi:uncharacterized protein (TIGR00369 family)